VDVHADDSLPSTDLVARPLRNLWILCARDKTPLCCRLIRRNPSFTQWSFCTYEFSWPWSSLREMRGRLIFNIFALMHLCIITDFLHYSRYRDWRCSNFTKRNIRISQLFTKADWFLILFNSLLQPFRAPKLRVRWTWCNLCKITKLYLFQGIQK